MTGKPLKNTRGNFRVCVIVREVGRLKSGAIAETIHDDYSAESSKTLEEAMRRAEKIIRLMRDKKL